MLKSLICAVHTNFGRSQDLIEESPIDTHPGNLILMAGGLFAPIDIRVQELKDAEIQGALGRGILLNRCNCLRSQVSL